MVTFQGHFDAGEERSKVIMEPLISFYRGCLNKDQTGNDGLRRGLKKCQFYQILTVYYGAINFLLSRVFKKRSNRQ